MAHSYAIIHCCSLDRLDTEHNLALETYLVTSPTKKSANQCCQPLTSMLMHQ